MEYMRKEDRDFLSYYQKAFYNPSLTMEDLRPYMVQRQDGRLYLDEERYKAENEWDIFTNYYRSQFKDATLTQEELSGFLMQGDDGRLYLDEDSFGYYYGMGSSWRKYGFDLSDSVDLFQRYGEATSDAYKELNQYADYEKYTPREFKFETGVFEYDLDDPLDRARARMGYAPKSLLSLYDWEDSEDVKRFKAGDMPLALEREQKGRQAVEELAKYYAMLSEYDRGLQEWEGAGKKADQYILKMPEKPQVLRVWESYLEKLAEYEQEKESGDYSEYDLYMGKGPKEPERPDFAYTGFESQIQALQDAYAQNRAANAMYRNREEQTRKERQRKTGVQAQFHNIMSNIFNPLGGAIKSAKNLIDLIQAHKEDPEVLEERLKDKTIWQLMAEDYDIKGKGKEAADIGDPVAEYMELSSKWDEAAAAFGGDRTKVIGYIEGNANKRTRDTIRKIYLEGLTPKQVKAVDAVLGSSMSELLAREERVISSVPNMEYVYRGNGKTESGVKWVYEIATGKWYTVVSENPKKGMLTVDDNGQTREVYAFMVSPYEVKGEDIREAFKRIDPKNHKPFTGEWAAQGFVRGMLNTASGMVNAVRGVDQALGLGFTEGSEWEKLSKEFDAYEEYAYGKTRRVSKAGQLAGDAVSQAIPVIAYASMGEMMASPFAGVQGKIVGTAAKAAGRTPFFIGVFGSNYHQAEMDGATPGQAGVYGFGMALVETLTEMPIVERMLGGGMSKTLTARVMRSGASNFMKHAGVRALDLILGGVAEGSQEVLAGGAGAFLKNVVYDPDYDPGEYDLEAMGQDFIGGVMMSVLFMCAGLPSSTRSFQAAMQQYKLIEEGKGIDLELMAQMPDFLREDAAALMDEKSVQQAMAVAGVDPSQVALEDVQRLREKAYAEAEATLSPIIKPTEIMTTKALEASMDAALRANMEEARARAELFTPGTVAVEVDGKTVEQNTWALGEYTIRQEGEGEDAKFIVEHPTQDDLVFTDLTRAENYVLEESGELERAKDIQEGITYETDTGLQETAQGDQGSGAGAAEADAQRAFETGYRQVQRWASAAGGQTQSRLIPDSELTPEDNARRDLIYSTISRGIEVTDKERKNSYTVSFYESNTTELGFIEGNQIYVNRSRVQTEQDALYVAGHEAYHGSEEEFSELLGDIKATPKQIEDFIRSLDVSEEYRQYLRDNPDVALKEMFAVEVGNTVAGTDRKSFLTDEQREIIHKNRDRVIGLLFKGMSKAESRRGPPKMAAEQAETPEFTGKVSTDNEILLRWMVENDMRAGTVLRAAKEVYNEILDDMVSQLYRQGFQGTESALIEADNASGYERIGYSRNASWYREMYASKGRQPTKGEIKEYAAELLREGYYDHNPITGDFRLDRPHGASWADEAYVGPSEWFIRAERFLAAAERLNENPEATNSRVMLRRKLKKSEAEKAEAINRVKAEYEKALKKERARVQELREKLAEQIKRTQSAEKRAQKAEKAVEALEEKLDKVAARLEEKAFNIKSYYLTKEKQAQARRKESEIRKNLLKAVQDLKKRAPKMVPEFKAAAMEIVDIIDSVAMSMTAVKEAELLTIKPAIEKLKAEYGEVYVDRHILQQLERLDKTQIRTMDIEDVERLVNAIRALIQEDANWKKANTLDNTFDFERENQDFFKIHQGPEGEEYAYTDEDKKRDPFLYNTLGAGALDGETMARRMDGWKDDGPFQRFYRELVNGNRRYLEFQRDSVAYLEKHIGSLDQFKNWHGKNAELFAIDLETGRREKADRNNLTKYKDTKYIVLDRGGIVALVLHAQNMENLRHIVYGGITGQYSAQNKKYPRKLTVEQLAKVNSAMTAEERKVAAAMDGYYNEFTKPRINAVSLLEDGYERATVEKYFPITTDRMSRPMQRGGVALRVLREMGMLKERTRGAKSPIILENVFDVYKRHTDLVGQYVGMELPLAAFSKWFGQVGIQRALAANFSEQDIRYWKDLFEYLDGNKERGDQGLIMKIFNNWAGAVLGANVGVMLKQLPALITAYREIDARYLAQAPLHKVDWDLIEKYSAETWYRRRGYIMPEMEGSLAKGRRWATVGIQHLDSLVIGWLWNAAEAETKARRKDLTVGSDAYYEHIARRMEDMTHKTQANYSTLYNPAIRRSNTFLSKVFSLFSSQSNKEFNMMVGAVHDILDLGNVRVTSRKTWTKENIKGIKINKAHWKRGVRTFAGLIASHVFLALIAHMFRRWQGRDDDRNLKVQKVEEDRILAGGRWYTAEDLDRLGFDICNIEEGQKVRIGTGWRTVEQIGKETVGSMIGSVYLARDIYNSVVEGYEFTMPPAEVWNDLADVIKLITGGSKKKSPAGIAVEFAEALGAAMGIPVTNVHKAIKNNLYNLDYRAYAAYVGALTNEVPGDFYDDFWKAMQGGDTERAQKVANAIWAAYENSAEDPKWSDLKNRIKSSGKARGYSAETIRDAVDLFRLDR